jgi:hypothetical protein
LSLGLGLSLGLSEFSLSFLLFLLNLLHSLLGSSGITSSPCGCRRRVDRWRRYLRSLRVLGRKTPRHGSDDVFVRGRRRRRDRIVGSELGNRLVSSFSSLGFCLLDLSKGRSGRSLDLLVVLGGPWSGFGSVG